MRSGKESKLHLKKGEKEGGGGKKIIPTYPASQTYSNPVQFRLWRRLIPTSLKNFHIFLCLVMRQ